MDAQLTIILIVAYFALLIGISYLTGKDTSNETFFTGKRSSPWYIVTFGMIGASLSGVTFVSVPGWVEADGFAYLQMCLGYVAGYIVISQLLLPVYYKYNLTSIYQFLGERFGSNAHKIGSFYFIISRLIGASFRLYLVANIFQKYIASEFGISFSVTVLITIILIWLYTFRSGIKTIVWTDTLQTSFMLLAVGISVYLLLEKQGLSFADSWYILGDESLNKIFFWEDWASKNHFVKQFISGMFITIAMTGLDQDMMQKNLTCKSLKEAQKNMLTFGIILVFVNFLFLYFGGILTVFSDTHGMNLHNDALFPGIAMSGKLGAIVATSFVLGLIASAYSSADSALASLTTVFCVDFLKTKEVKKRTRTIVHIGFSILLFIIIINFKNFVSPNIISSLFKAAGYTYGPLLGLFFFALWSNRSLRKDLVIPITILSPILTFILQYYLKEYYKFDLGFTLLPINGALNYLGLFLISKPEKEKTT
ncbi:MAG: sodium:solute symporter [Flavobacteriales bacterium]|jgi:Na+/proline symporter|nr:sodium:solute symporter [Flavobacteriales bacterium]